MLGKHGIISVWSTDRPQTRVTAATVYMTLVSVISLFSSGVFTHLHNI